jgi:SAM-dependent methyltransferase
MFPPEQVEPARLRALRESLERLGFTVPRICERAHCATIYDFQTMLRGRQAGTTLDDGLDALIRLFMDGAALPRETAEPLLTPALVRELEAIELIGPTETPKGPALSARALLYPTEGLFIASDLEFDAAVPDGRPDRVYPAITKSCEVHLTMVPARATGDFLELCSGTGIAALRAARTARHAWAVDITARSTTFARFNARLNGLDNVTALQGDLFEPVAGLQFDGITAHPPYVPAFEQREIYRDGGSDGEQISRRIFAEARSHLKPGGRLYCTCVLTDREQPLEERVRAMLGPDGADCDVLAIVSKADDPAEYLSKQVVGHIFDFEEANRFRAFFESLKVKAFAGVTVVIERHARARSPVTVRRDQGPVLAPINVDSILRWKGYPSEPEALRQLARIRPRLANGAHMDAVHLPRDGQWVLQRVRVAVDGPLPAAIDASPEASMFLAWCDGRSTVQELRERLVAEGAAGPDAPLERFAELIRLLLTAGILESEAPPE